HPPDVLGSLIPQALYSDRSQLDVGSESALCQYITGTDDQLGPLFGRDCDPVVPFVSDAIVLCPMRHFSGSLLHLEARSFTIPCVCQVTLSISVLGVCLTTQGLEEVGMVRTGSRHGSSTAVVEFWSYRLR